MLNDYCESAFYKANFSYGEYTARRGTQEARRFWFRWEILVIVTFAVR